MCKAAETKMENIVNKIQNLLDLASNNPSENEAISAALKAQELMAKYNLEMEDIEGASRQTEEIISQDIEFKQNSGYNIKWRFSLARIIASNFRCKYHRSSTYRGGDNVVFYGYESDVKIAVQVFNYLFEKGNKLSVKYYYTVKKESRPTKGLINCYLSGFMKGLKDVLEKQCTALMIVVPQEVENQYEEYSKGFTTVSSSLSYRLDKKAYDDGRNDGRNAANGRSLENSVKSIAMA